MWFFLFAVVPLLEKLLAAGLRVDGIYFMAPACSVELFRQLILPHYAAGTVKAFTQFYLTDTAECQDNCGTIYRRSRLYLVSNAGVENDPVIRLRKLCCSGILPSVLKAYHFRNCVA